MSAFTLKEHNNIPVTLPEGLTEQQVLSFRPFNEWIATTTESLARQSRPDHAFHEDPYALKSITIQAFDSWRPPRIGFLKLVADVANSAGEHLPGAIFLRGGSVAMLVMLIPDDAPAGSEEERYVLLTVQPRVPAGSLAFVELPAGMVDDAGSFAGAAAAEIKEELGLEINERELVCLTDLAIPGGKDDEERLPDAVFPSPGGCDECLRIFAHERRVPRAQLAEWTGKLTGLRDEGEKITLKLVPMRDLWREGARDGKALAALALWEGLKKNGKI